MENQKIIEMVSYLTNRGHVKEACTLLESFLSSENPADTTKKEAAGPDFLDYMKSAEEQFLKDVAKGIKQVARGHAESIKVERSRSTVWLHYVGQNRSDLDLDVLISLNWEHQTGPEVFVNMDVKDTYRGKHSETFTIPYYQLTPKLLVDKFAQVF